MRIAFLGGTFDPPHLGHLALGEAVLAAERTDLVLYVPAWEPPHKQNEPRSPFADRLAMTELMAARRPGMAVSDIERRMARKPSYSYDVLAALEAEYPGSRIQLLIGSDSLRQLHTWHRARELAERWELIVYPRPGELPERGELAGAWGDETAGKLLNHMIPAPFFEISSTEIRKKVAIGENPANIMVREVSDYVSEHRLYRQQNPEEVENMTEKTPVSAAELAKFCAKSAEDKLAENVLTLEVGSKSSVADYFVICTATSEPHLRSLAGFIERQARDLYGIRTFSESGDSSSGWMLLDFVSVVVHLMTPEARDRFSLETLWAGTPGEEAMKALEAKTSR